ncbi:MAG: ferritin-like domain-containing protein [Alphaproteobacteria bacterium]|nr:ferritin-like domain-containing protein [Alphaproteobacteria bacterium]HPF46679.1 ferritin-like domain-containing protein [Emcibacteraceae bacterium]HRW28792.1 ferritin-like domain-containing protein [Emcibacteraceae bacterium]
MNEKLQTLADAAHNALSAADIDDKIYLTFKAAADWRNGLLEFKFDIQAPERPGRLEKPELLMPKDMPKRRNAKARAARIAMLHAISHIELNAIDLAWDIVLRFGHKMPRDFCDDWIKVAEDEARHFELLNDRLKAFDSFYGALPAHDGLWQSAEVTAHDLLARLAIVPLVLEARGLDVTPAMIKKFSDSGDKDSVRALEIIYKEEIDHVRSGQKWFNFLCEKNDLNPQKTYQKMVRKYFAGHLKPPFNSPARDEAGLSEAYYLPLVENIQTH